MGTSSIPKIVLQFSVPAIISMLVEALYNIVDRYFVGQGVGSLGIGGITICFPIALFIMAMSMMVGVGGNTLFAIRLGERKYQQAAIILNNSFVLLIIMAVSSFTLGQIFMEPLLKLFGASDQLLPVASSYMRIILCGAIFQTIVPGMNHFIRSMGHPKTAMTRVMIGAGSNVILDWLFIMKFNWGIEGAAWATVLSQFIGGLAVMQFFVKKTTPIKVNRRYMKLRLPYVRKIFILGLPPSIMQISNSLVNAILARSLTSYGTRDLPIVNGMTGGDQAIAAFGILMSIVSMIVLPLMGFVTGSQPIIGYNYGARQYARVREVYIKTAMWGTIVTTVGFIVSEFLPDAAVSIFTNDPILEEKAATGLRMMNPVFPIVGFQMVTTNLFQCLGMVKKSIFLSLSRQLLFLLPCIYILPPILESEAGVWYSFPISDTVSAIITAILAWNLIVKLGKLKDGDDPSILGSQL